MGLSFKNAISTYVVVALGDIYKINLNKNDISVVQTNPEFEGDYTVILFSLTKKLNIELNKLGIDLGKALVEKYPVFFCSYEIKKGFLNLRIHDTAYLKFLENNFSNLDFGKKTSNSKLILIEYSSPNTNKPLHLGHLRNNFLGYSVGKIYEWNGYNVSYCCVVNDRGVHICKSMLAWKKWGGNATPSDTNVKGDHFVGDYYVKFAKELKSEQDTYKKNEGKEIEEKQTELMKQVQTMLVLWENGDSETLSLWNKMNMWVYEGFDVTYRKIGSFFNKIYYESDTYLLGKEIVHKGLIDNVFYKKEDGSIWVDLENKGLDHKLLLRKDGTSVYITQDLGLAELKYKDFNYDKSIYVVGDEQNYHFEVLSNVLLKLNKEYAKGISHLSYGMIELTTGKMKSREGNVVDADDIIDEMIDVAMKHATDLGKVEKCDTDVLQKLSTQIGLAALKFYLLKIEPSKRIVFNPDESIDFQGHTGPFIQYTHARIYSIIKKVSFDPILRCNSDVKFEKLERQLLLYLELFGEILEQALQQHNPSLVANYAYNLSQRFNSFYSQHSILRAGSDDIKNYRLKIAILTKNILSNCANILGFELPQMM